jgi:hypothetical protein
MLYPHLLALHNLLRWITLAAALVAVWVAASGWIRSAPVGPALSRSGRIFIVTMDLQLLLGLTLYFAVSPLTHMAFQNMSLAMKDRELRFFTVEHTTCMLIAVSLAHVGTVMTRKAAMDRAKYRRAAIAYTISLLVMLAGIPWGWRPLLRWGG